MMAIVLPAGGRQLQVAEHPLHPNVGEEPGGEGDTSAESTPETCLWMPIEVASELLPPSVASPSSADASFGLVNASQAFIPLPTNGRGSF